MEEYVVLVDKWDNEIGVAEKYAAHRYPAKLHRAFSIFILNDRGQLLIQKRNREKITWPGFWSNSCCSHPKPNEPIELAAQRRLEEELGFTCDVDFLFKFQYPAKYSPKWGENEVDHVFLGFHNGPVYPDPREVDDFVFVDKEKLFHDIKTKGHTYTPWLKKCFESFVDRMGVRNNGGVNHLASENKKSK